MLRLDTFIVAEFVSMLNFFYEKCWDTGLVTPTFIIEPIKIKRDHRDPVFLSPVIAHIVNDMTDFCHKDLFLGKIFK